MTETLQNPAENGATGNPAATGFSAAPEGFDASDVWVFPYTLKPYVNAEGHVPPPSQERIDRFQRDVAKFYLSYERAAREAEAAQAQANEAGKVEEAAEERSLEEMLAEVDRAVEEKNEAVGKMKDAVVYLCNGKPTRNQLEKLPEYVFMAFLGVLGRKINPEA